MPERVPPGRAGRIWLIRRLAAARRGADLLDRKRLLLRHEQQRLALERERTEREWLTACVEAEQWGLRAFGLAGTAAVSLSAASVAGRARAEVTFRNTMGVRHPGEVRCDLPELDTGELAAGTAATGRAAAAYRRALDAAAAHAVADAALRDVVNELSATQRRLRAIERHRLPRLEGALQALLLRLEELEREERVVTKWANDARTRARTPE